MELRLASEIACRLVSEMSPHCERVQIAGSIRRTRLQVKDIEICVVPRWDERPGDDLFGEPERFNALHEWAQQSGIRWIKTGTDEVVDWTIKPEGKWWKGLLAGGIKLDLFLATPQNFGLIWLIRTGSAEFSKAVVTHALRVGMQSRGGYLWRGDERLDTPDELDVFRELSLEYVRPALRGDASMLRRVRR